MWQGLFPHAVAADLLRRWAEPHRSYHSTTHLVYGLHALMLLDAEPLERVAFWFHDAAHSNSTPADELVSAALAGFQLSGVLPASQVREVQRLVLLTTSHRPEAGDEAGARVCDADLSGLAAPWPLYEQNSRDIRAEFGHLDDLRWRQGRGDFIERFLKRERIYHSAFGRQHWEAVARANLTQELAAIACSLPDVPG